MTIGITLLTALLLAPLASLQAADAPKKSDKPNIVFLYADDWGWGDLSCHGNTWLKTPRLDKLALDWNATLPTKADPSCVAKPQEGGPEKLPETAAPTKDRNIPFNRWDTNKDGVLTLDEYKAGQNGGATLEARFKNFDKNSDGKLSREEFVGPKAK